MDRMQELRLECECLRRERDIARDKLRSCGFKWRVLQKERDEARDWARKLYGRLEWWGGVCECGGIKATDDESMKCATCGKPGWNRGWE